jgi:hypothetical protein
MVVGKTLTTWQPCATHFLGMNAFWRKQKCQMMHSDGVNLYRKQDNAVNFTLEWTQQGNISTVHDHKVAGLCQQL